MNIDVFARIRAAGPSNIHTDGQHRVTSGPGGTYFRYGSVNVTKAEKQIIVV